MLLAQDVLVDRPGSEVTARGLRLGFADDLDPNGGARVDACQPLVDVLGGSSLPPLLH